MAGPEGDRLIRVDMTTQTVFHRVLSRRVEVHGRARVVGQDLEAPSAIRPVIPSAPTTSW